MVIIKREPVVAWTLQYKKSKTDLLAWKSVLHLSLLSDSNQRPRDYKSRALANWAKEAGGQATYIAPLQPTTFATFPSWRIRRELAVQDCPCYWPAKASLSRGENQAFSMLLLSRFWFCECKGNAFIWEKRVILKLLTSINDIGNTPNAMRKHKKILKINLLLCKNCHYMMRLWRKMSNFAENMCLPMALV